MSPVTVTVADAKNALGIGTTMIYELIGKGRLRTVKLGRRTLISTESIYALVEHQPGLGSRRRAEPASNT